ncbi:MAG: hypothetical protein HYY25_09890, partial [Candidatus Wallbacteria bacterium]|nr:hypothetical protein [Candidatus Wallbacteria bacterium]
MRPRSEAVVSASRASDSSFWRTADRPGSSARGDTDSATGARSAREPCFTAIAPAPTSAASAISAATPATGAAQLRLGGDAFTILPAGLMALELLTPTVTVAAGRDGYGGSEELERHQAG